MRRFRFKRPRRRISRSRESNFTKFFAHITKRAENGAFCSLEKNFREGLNFGLHVTVSPTHGLPCADIKPKGFGKLSCPRREVNSA